MILAWVISLLLLCSSLLLYLERTTALRIFELATIEASQKNLMAAEQSVIECEKNLTNLSAIKVNDCFIESLGKNYWCITSKQTPAIEIHVVVDEKMNMVTRLNWRQAFE
ncbi:hypothetical protein [Polynucleobacter necessarius]|uniref:hypothetical protein n=1 Tax=Polynucleobacter necessarius TaxID=576610 RepID=UPI000E096F14|nr:hypothetical protein [Polynucleobacter necessarius]